MLHSQTPSELLLDIAGWMQATKHTTRTFWLSSAVLGCSVSTARSGLRHNRTFFVLAADTEADLTRELRWSIIVCVVGLAVRKGLPVDE
jgi:hypothetical protein